MVKKIKFNPKKIVTFFIVTFPITKVYSALIPGISIGELLIIFSIVICFITKEKAIVRIPKNYLLFYTYMVFITPLMFLIMPYLNLSSYLHSFVSFTLSSFLIIFGSYYFDLNFGLKVLRKLMIFILLFLFLQASIAYIFNYHMVGLVPGLPLSNGVDSSQFLLHQSLSDRFSSFFEEPAHLSQYLMIGLIFSLFGTNKYFKYNLTLAIFITLGLILTKSGNALVILATVWPIWFLYRAKSGGLQTKFITSIFFAILLSSLIGLYFINDIFHTLINRSQEISGNVEGLKSGFIRVYRGYILFNEFNIIEKVFGIGSENIEMYIQLNPDTAYIELTDKIPNWLNGFQRILISGGVIGVFIYLRFNYNYFKNNLMEAKVLIISMFVLSLVSSIYSNPLWILIWILIISLSNNYIKLNKRGSAHG